MEDLNIQSQPVEEFPGKILRINGVEYLLGEMLGEGAEAYVFPAKNLRSGLIIFVAKVYRFLPNTEEYEHKRTEAPRLSTRLALEFDIPVEHCEYYEAHGGLIGFSELYEAFCDPKAGSEAIRPIFVDNPEYFPDLMNLAAERLDADDASSALRVLDEVLGKNPDHSAALRNKASCLRILHDPIKALGSILKALEIEPNDTSQYREAARIYVNMGRFDSAGNLLQVALERWQFDVESWKMLLEIASEFDLADIGRAQLDLMSPFVPASPLLPKFKQQLDESQKRRETYIDLVERSVELQLEGCWQEAAGVSDQAAEVSRNNSLARLNRYISSYHLPDDEKLGVACSTLAYVVGAGLTDTVALTSMLLCYKSGDWAGARRSALMINELIEDPADLPLVPVAAKSEMEVYALREASSIIDKLRKIVAETQDGISEREAMEALIEKYSVYKSLGQPALHSGR